jgi:hypothetical protein
MIDVNMRLTNVKTTSIDFTLNTKTTHTGELWMVVEYFNDDFTVPYRQGQDLTEVIFSFPFCYRDLAQAHKKYHDMWADEQFSETKRPQIYQISGALSITDVTEVSDTPRTEVKTYG